MSKSTPTPKATPAHTKGASEIDRPTHTLKQQPQRKHDKISIEGNKETGQNVNEYASICKCMCESSGEL